MSKRLLTTITTTAFTLLPTAIACACPMCKDSIPNSDAQSAGGLPSGFNNSPAITNGVRSLVNRGG